MVELPVWSSVGVAHAAVVGKALIALEKLSRNTSSSEHKRQRPMPSHARPAVSLTRYEEEPLAAPPTSTSWCQDQRLQ